MYPPGYIKDCEYGAWPPGAVTLTGDESVYRDMEWDPLCCINCCIAVGYDRLEYAAISEISGTDSLPIYKLLSVMNGPIVEIKKSSALYLWYKKDKIRFSRLYTHLD